MKIVKKILLAVVILILLFAGYWMYNKHVSPTRVAIINYPDFMLTKMVKSNDNSWIKLNAFKPDKLPNLNKYDAIIVFGMGIKLPATEEKKIAEAGENGSAIFIQAATNPRLTHLANLHGKPIDYLTEYLGNGGSKNYKNMLNYIRREIDNKTLFTDTIVEPQQLPSEVLFYKADEDVFETVSDFEKFIKEKNVYKKGAKKIAVFTSIPGPFNANRDHVNSLIEELESQNYNVYPIAAFSGRYNYLKEIQPDLVIYLPHGRFAIGKNSKKITQWLTENQVPVLCPVSVFQKHDDWLTDKQGMSGGLLSQSVAMPELDGGVVPYAVFAQYEEKGYLLFKAIPNRLKNFGELVTRYITLKDKKNKDKKVAIVYFKGPGKNALVAANMEVLPSLHNMLLQWQKEGYDLGNLPKDYETFEKEVYQKGPVLGPYAEGAFAKYLKTGYPELVAAETYNQWCKEELPETIIKDVEKKYGVAPGKYMSVYKNDTDYLAIARVQYGNVVLLPQPLPAVGNDEFKLIHGAKVAPPHSYIAPYLWIQKGFKADALFHFGTHGSLEFLPGKQIALSEYDWTDPLVGNIPHNYVYTISNVGEGTIAKRRSYAVTETYLTPPFIEAQAIESQEQSLHQKVHKYDQVSGALKREYGLSIKKMVVEKGIHKDLGLDSLLTEPYSEEDMMKLANYLEEIDHEKITGGLYTMGEPYDKQHIDETVLMMSVNPLSYYLAEIDIQKGLIKRSFLENKQQFNRKYTHPGESYIKKIMQKKATPEKVFQKIVSKKDYERAMRWKKSNGNRGGSMNMFALMGGEKKADKSKATEKEKKQLKQLIVQLIPQKEKIDYLKRIKSNKEYERVISLLNPAKKAAFKSIAKRIPAMAKAVKIAEDSLVKEVTKLIQKEELRQLTLTYIEDKNLEKEAAEAKRKQDNALLAQALSDKYYAITSPIDIEKIHYDNRKPYQEWLDFYTSKKKDLLRVLKASPQKEAQKLYAFLSSDYESFKSKVNRQLLKVETDEATFANAVFQVQSVLNNVGKYQKDLKESPQKEFDATLAALNGGYITPTSGGDPISNPKTIPTGRNLYAVDAEKTPSKESWKVAKKLAQSLLEDYQSKHDGNYPKKISFTLWSSSFIETEGTTVGQILYFLGVEPIWNPFGRVHDVRLIPLEELKRPRIDVLVQTSGQLRDIAASRLFLINKAIAMVASESEEGENNYVASGLKVVEKALIEKGFSPKKARALSKQRVFGGVNGNYGTGIMGMVESSDRWDSTRAVAQTYINNMGAIYGDEENWGEYEEGVFEAALLNTEAVVQPRQSNTWGALSLDHVYEFMGGINLAVKEVTGNDAEAYFNDFRNSSNAKVQGLKEAIWVESRTTLLNPRYIKELTNGGASSAETFAETFRNTFGWNVMKPSVIENRLWDNLYDVYVQDNLKLDLKAFFEKENPYALQEMTAVMLETVRKGMWKATPEQIKNIAKLHGELVNKHEAGCSGFVCDNQKLKNYIAQQLDSELREKYEKQIEEVREAPKKEGKESVVLKKDQTKEKINPKNSNPLFTNNKTLLIAISVVILLLIFFFVKRKKRK